MMGTWAIATLAEISMMTPGKKLLINLNCNATAVCIVDTPSGIVIEGNNLSGYKSTRPDEL
jgi:hypothetical protein